MTTVVRVGIVTQAFFFMPYYVGVQQGFYAAEGLDVEIKDLGGIDEVTRAIKDGEIEVGVGAPEHVIHDVEAGGRLRMIGGSINSPTHSLIARSHIKSLRDLKGCTIGVSSLSGGTSSLFMNLLEQEADLSYPEDYKLVVAGPVPQRHDLLMDGTIDAAMQTDPHNYIAEDEGLTNLGPVNGWIPHFQFVSLNAGMDWAEANRDVCVGFLAASIRATMWMKQNKDAAVDLVCERMGVERKYAVRAWEDHMNTDALPLDLRLNRRSIATALDMIRKDRWSSIEVRPEADPNDYVDVSFVKEAQSRAETRVNPMDH